MNPCVREDKTPVTVTFFGEQTTLPANADCEVDRTELVVTDGKEWDATARAKRLMVEAGIVTPEFYADLAYDGAGNLILSRVHDAVDPVDARKRVLRALNDGLVTTTEGHDIAVKATTICVHSDTPDATAIAAELSRVLRSTEP